MTLRTRTLLTIVVTLSGLIVVLFWLTQRVLAPIIQESEQESVLRDIDRASRVLADRRQYLDQKAADWATWDDTYIFVQDHNQAYIESNLQPSSLQTLQINILIFQDSQGQIVSARGYDLNQDVDAPVSTDLLRSMQPGGPLWEDIHIDEPVAGVVLLASGDPFLFASRPILTSLGEGPYQGRMIMGIYLDQARAAELAETVQLSFSLLRLDQPGLAPELQAIAETLDRGSPGIAQPQNEQMVMGYGLVRDVFGRPALLMEVQAARVIYGIGQESMGFLLFALAGIGLVSALLTAGLIEHLVLSPIARLSKDVDRVGKKKDLALRVHVTGTDELGRLASDINSTLETLQHSQVNLQESEARFRGLVENAPVLIYTVDCLPGEVGKIHSLNPAFKTITGWDAEEWLGRPFTELILPEDRAKVTAALHENQPPAPQELRILTRSGGFAVCEFITTPLFELGVEVGELGIGRDVTERRIAEDALRRRLEEQDVLHKVAVAATDAVDEDMLIERATEIIGKSLYPDQFGIMLANETEKSLHTHTTYRGIPEQAKLVPVPFGKGVTGHVAETGLSLRVADVTQDPLYIPLGDPGIRAELCVPLKLGERVIGVINTESMTPGDFNESDEHLLTTVAGQLATAIARLRVEAAERLQARQLATIYEVGKEIFGAILDTEQVYRAIHQAVAALMPAEAFVITVHDPLTQKAEVVYLIDRDGRYPVQQVLPHHGLSGYVISSGESLSVQDWLDSPGRYPSIHFGTTDSVRSIVAVPMRLRGQVVGMLSSQSYQPNAYTPEDLHVLELLAAYAAVALGNAHLYEEIRRQALTFENMFDAIILTDMDEQIIDWNPAAARMFGYNRSEVLGRSPTLVHRPEDIPGLQQEINQSISVDGRWSGEITFIRRDGSRGVSEVVIVPLRDEQGEIIATVGVNRDISARKQREHEMQGIAQVSMALRVAKDRSDMVPVILDQLIDLLHAGAASLILRNPKNGTMKVELAKGEWAELAGHTLPDNGSLSSEVTNTGTPFFAANILGNPRFFAKNLIHRNYAVGAVPLVTQDDYVGVLWVGRDEAFTPSEARLLAAVADIAANALHRSALYERTLRYAEQMATVSQIGRDLAETHDLSSIFARLARTACDLLPDVMAVVTSLYDPNMDVFQPRSALIEGQPVNAQGIPALYARDLGFAGPSATHGVYLQHVKALPDAWSAPHHGFDTSAWDIHSGIHVPMLVKGEVLGAIQVYSRVPEHYSDEDCGPIVLVANTAAISIENVRLFSETELRLRRLAALRTMDVAISSSFDLRVTLSVLLDQVTSQLGVDAAAVLLFNKNTQMLDYAAGRGFRSSTIALTRIHLGEDLAGRAALEHRLVSTNDLLSSPGTSARLAGEDFVSYFGTPLIAKGQIKGVLEIFHRAALHPDPEWLDYLETLAGDTAIAIDSSSLFNELQRSNTELTLAYDTTLEGWSRALELRDRETEGHAQRVAELTIRLARSMGVAESEILHIRRGALLHDIGKMGVPDSILLKNGPLTLEEKEIMQRHPVYAFDMLSHIPYLRQALDIPYYHHERWDGTGYPNQLAGKQIPLAARIFAVVDVWDALRSARPYRPPWSDQNALEYICQQSGAHFDAQVVDVFVKLVGTGPE